MRQRLGRSGSKLEDFGAQAGWLAEDLAYMYVSMEATAYAASALARD